MGSPNNYDCLTLTKVTDSVLDTIKTTFDLSANNSTVEDRVVYTNRIQNQLLKVI